MGGRRLPKKNVDAENCLNGFCNAAGGILRRLQVSARTARMSILGIFNVLGPVKHRLSGFQSDHSRHLVSPSRTILYHLKVYRGPVDGKICKLTCTCYIAKQ